MYRDIRGAIVKFPFVAGPEMNLSGALSYMRECNIRHLPIINNDEIIGLVSERDLQAEKNLPGFETKTIGEIVHQIPFVVSENESLQSVLTIMIQNKYGSALVMNSQEQLVGIFTTIDAMRLLRDLINGENEKIEIGPEPIPLFQALAWN